MASHSHGASKDPVQVKHTFIDVKPADKQHREQYHRHSDTCVEYASARGKPRASTASRISQSSTVEPVIELDSDSEGSAAAERPRFETGGSDLDFQSRSRANTGQSERRSRKSTGHSEARSRMNTGSFSMGSDYDYPMGSVNSYASALSGPPGSFGAASSTGSFGSQGYALNMSQMAMMMPMPMMTHFYAHQAGAAAAMAASQECASGRRSRANSGRESVSSIRRRTASDASTGKHSEGDGKEKKTKKESEVKESKAKKEPEPKVEKEQAPVVEVPESERTTVIFRHLVKGCTRDDLLGLLVAEGFERKFDFVYMPTHFKDWSCFGYAFVNFRTNDLAIEAMQYFQGREWETADGDQPCEVVWSTAHQGLESHIERYRNSPLMHEAVPDDAKPILLDEDGRRAPFPPPTRRIKPPRARGADLAGPSA